MSQNEVDETTRETGRTFRQILETARGYIAAHRARHGYTGARKLSRAERREMVEAIQARIGEERIAAAWFHKRVTDYRTEAQAFQQRQLAGVDMAQERTRMAAMRYSIESTLHNTALRLEHRGQVVQALDELDRNPEHTAPVFVPMTAEAALEAREAGVRSERWIASRQQENARLLAEQRAMAEQRARAGATVTPNSVLAAENAELRRQLSEMRTATPGSTRAETVEVAAPDARPGGDYNDAQAEAVQEIRAAGLRWHNLAPTASLSRLNSLDHAARMAAQKGLAAGMSPQQVDHEREYAVENSRFAGRVDSNRGAGTRTYSQESFHPTEAEAVAWTDRKVRETPWVPGVQLKAAVHERARAGLSYHQAPTRVSDGGFEHVAAATREWVSERDSSQVQTSESSPGWQQRADELAKQVSKLAAENKQLRAQNDKLTGRDQKAGERGESADQANGHSWESTRAAANRAAEREEDEREREEWEDAEREWSPPHPTGFRPQTQQTRPAQQQGSALAGHGGNAFAASSASAHETGMDR
ncbi:hypothetical protein AB0C65_38250 [Nocardia sp. NPDC048505]|uniref:hypothetical protein n=1 Tax=Nocardia sp. NPDC048505 TaxID=3155756 RepID=UPI0033F25667